MIPSFDEYLGSLGRLSQHVDPSAPSAAGSLLRDAADSLAALDWIDRDILVAWVRAHPQWVPALGLAVGLSQEKLRNSLRHEFDTQSWAVLAKARPHDLVDYLDREFEVVKYIGLQRHAVFDFGDIIIARAGTRASAIRAGASGRRVEDEIERIATDLGLDCATRTRFEGRNGRTAPCDLAIPSGPSPDIVVAAKGFDSTGSKLTDAVREIEEMADVRLPRQVVFAVIDGIGWKSRKSDLKRIHGLWESRQIDGMYTLATLGAFRTDLEEAARLRGLLPV